MATVCPGPNLLYCCLLFNVSHCSCLNAAVPLKLPQCLIAGGSNPVFDEVVVSLSLMNRVISLDETAGTLPDNFSPQHLSLADTAHDQHWGLDTYTQDYTNVMMIR